MLSYSQFKSQCAVIYRYLSTKKERLMNIQKVQVGDNDEKYIVAEVRCGEESVFVLRAGLWAKESAHRRIYDALLAELRESQVDIVPCGGGDIRVYHEPWLDGFRKEQSGKTIWLSGTSGSFGRNREIPRTIEILAEQYPGYTVEVL